MVVGAGEKRGNMMSKSSCMQVRTPAARVTSLCTRDFCTIVARLTDRRRPRARTIEGCRVSRARRRRMPRIECMPSTHAHYGISCIIAVRGHVRVRVVYVVAQTAHHSALLNSVPKAQTKFDIIDDRRGASAPAPSMYSASSSSIVSVDRRTSDDRCALRRRDGSSVSDVMRRESPSGASEDAIDDLWLPP